MIPLVTNEFSHAFLELSEELLLSDSLLIDRSQIPLLTKYAWHLLYHTQFVNLTGIKDIRGFVIHHAVDSLVAMNAIGDRLNKPIIDLGSGGGIPGIIWKIANPNLAISLSESIEKKANYLQAACNYLDLKITVINPTRSAPTLKKCDLVARAVAPLDKLRMISKSYIKSGQGCLIAMKGKLTTIKQEIDGLPIAERKKAEIIPLHDSRLPGERHLVIIPG